MEHARGEALLLPPVRDLRFHRKRAAPDHFDVNVFCLEDFDADDGDAAHNQGFFGSGNAFR
jgi:hypothetical protein